MASKSESKVKGKKSKNKGKDKSSQISSKSKGPQNIKIFTWQMEKFQVMLSDSDNIMVALMLESEPSDAIKKALINFTYQFEVNYEQAIKNFRGQLQVFNSARPMAEDIFNLFLMQPQMLPLDIKIIRKAQLSADEKRLIKTAQKLQQERGYFFFTHLISEHAKKYKVNQNTMFKMIFDLYNKGIFISIPPERVCKEIERYQIFNKLCVLEGLCDNDIDILLKDLLASSPESRELLLEKVSKLKKKNMSELIQQEILNRNTLRKQRSELFEQIDGFLQVNDYENIIRTFNRIIEISNQLGDYSMSRDLEERAKSYQQAIEQMTTLIPQIRSARNEALNKAELYELAGKYLDAAECYKQAAEYSMELGEIEASNEYKEHAERMVSLEELAKLRRSLGA
ncbi:MAG: hypothetical protein ACTSPY_17840 [Candidatus Helarchaeota archaeon]